jgi:ribose transport system substrate-binding protein
MIVSQGANEEGLKQLRTNPVWVAEGSVFFELWSDYLLAMGVSMMNGVTPPALTTPPQMVMSKADVDQYYDANNKLIGKPAIPEADAYLLESGVLQALGHEPAS